MKSQSQYVIKGEKLYQNGEIIGNRKIHILDSNKLRVKNGKYVLTSLLLNKLKNKNTRIKKQLFINNQQSSNKYDDTLEEEPSEKYTYELSEIDTPNVEINTPYVEIETHNVEINTPNVEIETPNVEINTPNVEIERPYVEIDTSTVELHIHNVEVDTPNIESDTLNVEINTPNVEVDIPNIEADTPNVEIDIPKVEVDIPNIEADTPNVEIDIPKVEIDRPKVEIDTPKVEIERPNVEINTNDVVTDTPKVVTETHNVVIDTNNVISQYSKTSSGGIIYITNIVLNTLCNDTTSTSITRDLPFYNAFSFGTYLVLGKTYSLTVTVCDINITYPAAIVSVWIDWNQTNSYNENDWIQVSTYIPIGESATVEIVVPMTAKLGTTGMRIRSRGASDGNKNGPKDAYVYMGSGDTQDYPITILSEELLFMCEYN
jgi:hypothetical protein